MDLRGKRVLITRPPSQADEFAERLRAMEAVPILFPVIEIGPAQDFRTLDQALRELAGYAWVIFTSVNGVQAVWERLQALGLTSIPSGVRVAAIGPKTAQALRKRSVKPDYIPQEYIAEALVPGLGDLRGRRVLLPRADLARPALAQAIRQAGGIPHEVVAYRTLPASPGPGALEALRAGCDVVTFTSPSTVRNFVALVSAAGLEANCLPGSPIFACIGPITASAAASLGLPVAMVAETYTTDGLLLALLEYSP